VPLKQGLEATVAYFALQLAGRASSDTLNMQRRNTGKKPKTRLTLASRQ
jgi:hypothetical protein